MAINPGTRLGPYEILSALGAGGMGEVYRARDTRLNRDVAIKVLPEAFARDAERLSRFTREAQTLAALNHPNIAQIHGLEEDASGVQVLVLELVEGVTLAERIAHHPIGFSEAVSIGRQIAQALDTAHERGIIHRDLKPANVKITSDGSVKILDFGLAKSSDGSIALPNVTTMTAQPATMAGTIVGTWPYMSPEQAQGLSVDRRTDLWSLGVVLYEMVTQRRPFSGATAQQIVFEIVQKPAPAATGAPQALQRIVALCLAKDPAERYQSAAEVVRDLDTCAAAMQKAERGFRALVATARRRRIAVPALFALAAALGLAGWALQASSMRRWAREEAVPRARALADQGNYVEAYEMAAAAEPYIPTDPTLRDLWPDLSRGFSVETTPEGANATWKPYAEVNAAWRPLGLTPVGNYRLPLGPVRIRLVKTGYLPLEVAASGAAHRLTLLPEGTPPDMVAVPAAAFNAQYGGIGTLNAWVPDYLIDRHEVTNREFKRFVDSGGYTTRAYWTEPFVDGDRILSWEDAMRRFVDPTGQPGPATWDGGAFKDGEDDVPVAGVSWYEAAAYAAFARRSLPTVYHWLRAANTDDSRFLVALSNFSGAGPAAVGRSNAIGSFGPVDMAGNVREWCWNATGHQRYLLGGSWADPAYMLTRGQLAPPLDRSITNGFRCAEYSSKPLPPALTDPINPRPPPAYLSAAPASNEVFEIYRSIYTYDPVDVQAVVESVDDRPAQWRRETVRIKAAYGDETMLAYLFLPKNRKPPYACVIDVPSDVAFVSASGATIRPDSYVLSSGRAMVYPIFKGTFNRYSGPPSTDPIAIRDYLIMWRKDLGRALDYLQTRTDIDPSKIAYMGHSMGAEIAPMLLAAEPRVSVAVLLSGGLSPFFGKLPEINAINFLPHVRIPVLMVNGAYDSILPVTTSQEPMWQRLGTAPAQKRHIVFNAGHAVTVPEVRNDLVREVLSWLDSYLGKT